MAYPATRKLVADLPVFTVIGSSYYFDPMGTFVNVFSKIQISGCPVVAYTIFQRTINSTGVKIKNRYSVPVIMGKTVYFVILNYDGSTIQNTQIVYSDIFAKISNCTGTQEALFEKWYKCRFCGLQLAEFLPGFSLIPARPNPMILSAIPLIMGQVLQQ
jgi:hypothetical protein